MALKQRNLQLIPQRTKDLVLGFIHEREQIINNTSIPTLIKYLILVHLNPNKDKFDSSSSVFQINGNEYCEQRESYLVV